MRAAPTAQAGVGRPSPGGGEADGPSLEEAGPGRRALAPFGRRRVSVTGSKAAVIVGCSAATPNMSIDSTTRLCDG